MVLVYNVFATNFLNQKHKILCMVKVTDYFEKEEFSEEALHHFMKTNWPKPMDRWRLIYEIYNQSIEDLYFRAIDFVKEENEFPIFVKITDLFAASEQSAFFGASQQRLGLQQDKVSQFLATIGKMVKELFQLVREIRILDERLEFYYQSAKNDISAEISLKGYWIDLVEGGAKNPASVYGMARELGFTTLPDIFFAAPPLKADDVDKYVKTLQFSNKLLEVLARKLKTFLVWKKHTYKELIDRRIFTIKYLRQHYDVIKMYMNWVKPYLKNIRRLQMDEKRMDSANLISAFEGAMIEIETLAIKPFEDKKTGAKVNAIYSFHFEYRTRPEMRFQQEGYQRGPMHIGKTTMTLRTYAWTDEEIEKYKEFRSKEEFDLLASIDSSVAAAYTALGDELERYLKEAGSENVGEFHRPILEAKEEHGKKPSMASQLFDPFLAPFKSNAGHGKHIGHDKKGGGHGSGGKNGGEHGNHGHKRSREYHFAEEEMREQAEGHCKGNFFNFQKRYKAAYGFHY